MLPGGLEGATSCLPGCMKDLVLTHASEQKVRGLPFQKVVVTTERRWMVQRQADRGQVVIGEAYSSQGAAGGGGGACSRASGAGGW